MSLHVRQAGSRGLRLHIHGQRCSTYPPRSLHVIQFALQASWHQDDLVISSHLTHVLMLAERSTLWIVAASCSGQSLRMHARNIGFWKRELGS